MSDESGEFIDDAERFVRAFKDKLDAVQVTNFDRKPEGIVEYRGASFGSSLQLLKRGGDEEENTPAKLVDNPPTVPPVAGCCLYPFPDPDSEIIDGTIPYPGPIYTADDLPDSVTVTVREYLTDALIGEYTATHDAGTFHFTNADFPNAFGPPGFVIATDYSITEGTWMFALWHPPGEGEDADHFHSADYSSFGNGGFGDHGCLSGTFVPQGSFEAPYYSVEVRPDFEDTYYCPEFDVTLVRATPLTIGIIEPGDTEVGSTCTWIGSGGELGADEYLILKYGPVEGFPSSGTPLDFGWNVAYIFQSGTPGLWLGNQAPKDPGPQNTPVGAYTDGGGGVLSLTIT